MKKKVLSIVMALSLMVGLLPTVALAADTLPEAVNGVITINTDMNIDLTDKTIVGSGDVVLVVSGDAVVTITGGTIKNDSAAGGAIRLSDNANVTLINTTVTGVDYGAVLSNSAKLTIGSGATVQTTGTSTGWGCGDGVRAYKNSTLIVADGGSVKAVASDAKEDDGVECYDNSKIIVETGGSVTGDNSGIATKEEPDDYNDTSKSNCDATITVEAGATVTGNRNAAVNATSPATVVTAGDLTGGDSAVWVGKFAVGAEVTVTGGTLTDKSSNNTGSVAVSSSAANDSTVTITGGTFKGKINDTRTNKNTTITGGTFQDANGNPINTTDLKDYLPTGLELGSNGTVGRAGPDLSVTDTSGGLGTTYTVTNAKGDWTYTVQVKVDNQITSLTSITLPTGQDGFTVSAPKGSAIEIWETIDPLTFDDGAPVQNWVTKYPAN